MRITLRQLSYLRALAQTGHFGRAAELCHVSQPALSVQIRELENLLGTVLVERGSREARLTLAGREVLARAGRILDEVMELESAARRGGLGGTLTLGVIPTVAPYLMPRALALIAADRDLPGDLRLREAETETLLRELRSGRLDAVLIATPGGEDLIEHPLFSDRFLLAASAARISELSGRLEALRPQELDPDQLLLLDEGHCLADQALEVCGLERRSAGQGSRARIDLGASSLSTLCGLVAAGMGYTFVPELAVKAEAAAAPGMELRHFAEPEPARTLRLLRRRASSGEGWFEPLARQLARAGEELISAAAPVARTRA